MLVEVIVTNVPEAIKAQEFGANRLELIHAFELGGLSPSLKLTKQVCEAVSIPVNVMLRPHGESFVYNKTDELKTLKEIEHLHTHTRVNGIVFGALTLDNRLDVQLLELVIKNKGNLDLIFHRAIDVSYDPLRIYQELLQYTEISTVLTSGGADTAEIGIPTIRQMVKLKGELSHANILAGSGVTPNNARYIVEQTGVNQIHVGTGVRTNGVLDKDKFKQLLSAFD